MNNKEFNGLHAITPELIKLVFTSFRDSLGLDGLKVSIDRNTPKPCAHPILSYMVMPFTKHLTAESMERICNTILDNNWSLIYDFINSTYNLGVHQIVFCCWCTTEQITYGRFCAAGIIGKYILARGEEFDFPVEINYEDGRRML